MQRTIIDLPCSLAPITRDWYIDSRGRSAGEGVTGDGQVVYTNRAKWVATLDFGLFRRPQVLTWQAITAKMRGRVQVIRMCLCDPYRATLKEIGLPEADRQKIKDGLPFSDQAYFDDGAGFEYEPVADIGGAAPAGANSILINGDQIGNALQPGQTFSIDDWLYRCTGIQGTGDTTAISFEPPLRESVDTSDIINLHAKAIMAFDTDMQGRVALDMGRRGRSTLQLVEMTNRRNLVPDTFPAVAT